MLICEVTEDKRGETTVYGFRFLDRKSREEVYTVSDVFTDEKAAYSLFETVNQSEVCREHIKDIIEDAMGR